MKTFGNTLGELRNSTEIPRRLKDYINESIDIVISGSGSPDSESALGESVENSFGGNFFLVESKNDLHQIKTARNIKVYSERNSQYLSIEDEPDGMDVCEWLDNDKDSGYVVVALFTNNAGGNTYFIPAEFVTENVLKSIELTQKLWA